MTPLRRQFEAVQAAHPNAALQEHADGSATIFIPGLRLSNLWNRPQTDVWFIAPVGYPGAKPDCFWATPGLALRNGNPPQNTGATPLPHGPAGLLWFSWHVANWSPLSDSLMTYLHVIENRFREAR